MRNGEHLLNFKASANRDAAVWTDPDRFDSTRDQDEPIGGTVAFGQGVHFCAGAGVARLAGPIAVTTLLDRFPNMRLRDGWTPVWHDAVVHHKLVELPVTLG
jgi:cytochrome P450